MTLPQGESLGAPAPVHKVPDFSFVLQYRHRAVPNGLTNLDQNRHEKAEGPAFKLQFISMHPYGECYLPSEKNPPSAFWQRAGLCFVREVIEKLTSWHPDGAWFPDGGPTFPSHPCSHACALQWLCRRDLQRADPECADCPYRQSQRCPGRSRSRR